MFFLLLLSGFSPCLWFSAVWLLTICVGVVLFIFILPDVLWASRICKFMSFTKFEENLTISIPVFLFSLDFNYTYIDPFNNVPHYPDTVQIFFSLFFRLNNSCELSSGFFISYVFSTRTFCLVLFYCFSLLIFLRHIFICIFPYALKTLYVNSSVCIISALISFDCLFPLNWATYFWWVIFNCILDIVTLRYRDFVFSYTHLRSGEVLGS